MLVGWINSILGFFYQPFRNLVPYQTFRYAVCGGSNMMLDIFIYWLSFHFIANEQVVYTPLGAVKPQNIALMIAFCVSFPMGYLLNRYIVFTGSILKGPVQLFRYFLLVIACLVLNYLFVNLFVEYCHIYPTVSKMLTTVIVVSFSYVTQKKFTFKGEAL
ncbi:MAG: GtrA family protein [Flavitalea sp.]